VFLHHAYPPLCRTASEERPTTKDGQRTANGGSEISSIISRPIMICSNCAAEMPGISAFCPACGSSVNADSDSFRASDVTDHILGAVAYVAVVPAVVLLIIPALRHRLFVRFHAWQGLLFTAAVCVIALVLRLLFLLFSILPLGGSLIAWLLIGVGALAVTILWATLLVKAALGDGYELPFVGDWAARLAR
jgi:uncharacterized membrane protein